MSLRNRIERLTRKEPSDGETLIIDLRGGGEPRHYIRRDDGTTYEWTPEWTARDKGGPIIVNMPGEG